MNIKVKRRSSYSIAHLIKVETHSQSGREEKKATFFAVCYTLVILKGIISVLLDIVEHSRTHRDCKCDANSNIYKYVQ